MMTLALATPVAVVRYLVHQVGVELGGEAHSAIGFWTATSSKLTKAVDLDGLDAVEVRNRRRSDVM
jgi:hypothetical protein